MVTPRWRIPRPARLPLRMKVIMGLGNPGREYEDTRHNVGWWLLDHLAQRWHADPWRKDGEAVTAAARLGPHALKLVKPQTYMNLSGAALRPYLRRTGWTPAQDLLVLVDEVAVPVGEYRLRAAGSPGGHNGLKSVEAHLKSPAYPRLRIGIRPVDERRTIGDLAAFVLRTMPQDERALYDASVPRLVEAVECWITEGTEKAVSSRGR
jgi:PTH1 family peptidyl-tRNA hydrolase